MAHSVRCRGPVSLNTRTAAVVELDSARDGLEQLRSGANDAFSSDQVVLTGLTISSEDVAKFTISPGVFSFEPVALAIRRNDADLRLVADRTIVNLYRTEQILPIYDKRMGRFSRIRPPAFDTRIQLNAIPVG